MKLETKFEIGEKVFTINNDEIVSLPIQEIEYRSEYKSVKYTLLKYKAVNFGDKDGTITKNENECFKSIDELSDSYKNKLKNQIK